MQRLPQKRFDTSFLLTILALLFFGIIMVYDASVVYAYDIFGGKYHFLVLQLVWAGLGLVVMFVVAFTDYKFLRKVAPSFFIFCLFCLVIVLIPGIGSKVMGARRWIRFGSVGFQPSELVKLGFTIYLASWLTSKRRGSSPKTNPLPFVGLLFALVGLVMLQPDFGTAVIIASIGIIIYFISGAPVWYFLVGAPVLAGTALAFIFSSTYRRQRLMTFLSPSQADPLGAGYHIQQALIALGSGGFFGLGLGQSRQKYEYLPEVSGDSIFAIIGEELGFVGAVVIIALFIFLIYRGVRIAQNAKDEFGQLLATGIISWIALQMIVNVAAITGLIPLTGAPLPLISYGGSSLVFTLAGLGVVLNVSRN